MKKIQRLIINKIIDGVLVVALENVPGKKATQVRVIKNATKPLDPAPKADDFFVPGIIVKDIDLANTLGQKAFDSMKK